MNLQRYRHTQLECLTMFDGFCRCVDGFEGHQCEVNINDCYNDTCLNGGECMDGVNNYTCICSAGWSGRHCSVDINECRPENPCQQDGICIENETPPGFR
mgnify:CR=1 FL=1